MGLGITCASLVRRLALAVLIVGAGAVAAQSAEARWAFAPHACDGEQATRDETPLIFADDEIRWFDHACQVVSSYKVKDALFLQAQCRNAGKSSTIPIMLEPNGARLRVGWNREPVREMQRCRWPGGLGFQ
jgi:hypothetical protein